jgi:hypothetical protein
MKAHQQTVTLPIRRVIYIKDSVNHPKGGYQVFQKSADNPQWNSVSKEYGHSTSAFAALGRLTQKDTPEIF